MTAVEEPPPPLLRDSNYIMWSVSVSACAADRITEGAIRFPLGVDEETSEEAIP